MPRKKWVREVRGIGLALALGCSMLGCHKARSPSGPLETVRGKVTYKGEPLPKGFVHFYNGSGYVGMGMIKWDGSGSYEAFVPAGPVQAIVKADAGVDRVDRPPVRPGKRPGGPGAPPVRPGMPPGAPGVPGRDAGARPGSSDGLGKRVPGGAGEASKPPQGVKRFPRLALDAKQVKLMEEVQEKYGTLRKPAKLLTFVVAPGEQTWNIDLD